MPPLVHDALRHHAHDVGVLGIVPVNVCVHLTPIDVLRLACCSRALSAWASAPPLWRALAIRDFPGAGFHPPPRLRYAGQGPLMATGATSQRSAESATPIPPEVSITPRWNGASGEALDMAARGVVSGADYQAAYRGAASEATLDRARVGLASEPCVCMCVDHGKVFHRAGMNL